MHSKHFDVVAVTMLHSARSAETHGDADGTGSAGIRTMGSVTYPPQNPPPVRGQLAGRDVLHAQSLHALLRGKVPNTTSRDLWHHHTASIQFY